MGCGWGRERVEVGENTAVCVREEVAVEVQRDADRRVPHLRLEVLRVCARGDHQRGVGVAEIVEAEAGQTGAADGRPEDTVAEVVVIQDLAAGRREDEAKVVGLPREQLAAEDVCGRAGEIDAAAGGARLHRHELALVGAVLGLNRERLEVDVAIAEREQLALPEAGQRREQHEVAVGSQRVGGELVNLRPREEAHLRLLAPRRLHAEDTLVDEVPALLRVREHLLEHAERELGLAGRATCERGDVILDGRRTDLVERERAEDVEVRQHVADARERRGAHAQRVALEPARDEVGERLRRRLVERAQRRPALLLENETIGVLLQRARAGARAPVDADPAGSIALPPIPQPVALDVRHDYSNSLGCPFSRRLGAFGRVLFRGRCRRAGCSGSTSRWEASHPRSSSGSKRRVPPSL
jgi:hypothetical protein